MYQVTYYQWITDWKKIQSDKKYIVCPINFRLQDNEGEPQLYLGQPIGFLDGWQVSRLMQGCYAALEAPEFFGTDV